MPQRIEVPGMGVVEFPDGMSDAEIAAAIQRNSAPKAGAGERFAAGLADPVHGGAQLLTKMLPQGVVAAGNQFNNWLADKTGLVARLPEGGVDQQAREREADLRARAPEGVDWARLAGNVASPVNLSIARLAPGAAATLGGRMAQGSVLGAATAMTAPVAGEDFAAEKAKQAAFGAVGGAVVPAIVAGAGRVISPLASQSPQLALLRGEGVRPTIGQTLGGAANRAEEKLQSLPLLGDAITAARNRAREQFNVAAINRAGAPIGAKADGAGQEAVASVGNKISAAYEAAKAQLGHFQLDRQAASELNNLHQLTRSLGDKERAIFDRAWSNLDREISPNGSLLAEGFKRFDSHAGKEASRFMGSSDAYQQQVGEAIRELQRIVLDAGKRANPQAANAMGAADAAWANLVRIEGAAKAALNSGGVFTPAQLQAAVRQADTSVRDRATARGTALMQDLSGAAQSVLGSRVPDSGTAGRMFLGGGALASGAVAPAVPIGLLGAAASYAPPVQGLLAHLVSTRPKAAKQVAGLLQEIAPVLAPTGGLLSLEAFQK